MMLNLENAKWIIIGLIILNFAFTIWIDILRNRIANHSNIKRALLFSEIAKHTGKMADAYLREIDIYAKSERRFLTDLVDIFRSDIRYYNDPKLIKIVNDYTKSYEKRVANTNNITKELSETLKELQNGKEDTDQHR